MKSSTQRLEWIDVARGLLIMIVIFHHFPMVGIPIFGQVPIWGTFDNLKWLYGPFFMAAFFIITGYCSNYEKDTSDFMHFVLKNFKTLIWSNFWLCIGVQILSSVACRSLDPLLTLLDLDFWFFRSFWFFKALFFAKIIYWVIKRLVKSDVMKVVILLIFLYVGVLLYRFEVIPNYFYFRNGFIFCIFIFIGDYLKNRLPSNKTLILGGGNLSLVIRNAETTAN